MLDSHPEYYVLLAIVITLFHFALQKYSKNNEKSESKFTINLVRGYYALLTFNMIAVSLSAANSLPDSLPDFKTLFSSFNAFVSSFNVFASLTHLLAIFLFSIILYFTYRPNKSKPLGE